MKNKLEYERWAESLKVTENSLVSILVPCYNHELYLKECIQSILDQNYRDIEVLIADDCSTDNSWEIINKHKKALDQRFERVILIRNESNLGLTKNVNQLLKLAKGNYIKLIASDDVLLKDCISVFVEYLNKNNSCDVAVSNGYIFTEELPFKDETNKKLIYQNAPDFSKETLFIRLYCGNFIFAPAVMVKKKVYDKNGLYDEAIDIEDWEYWLRLAKNGVNFDYIDKCLIGYRKNSNSFTSKENNPGLEERRRRIHRAEIRILDKYGKYVPINIYAKYKISKIVDERKFARKHNLKQLEKELKNEWARFDMWNEIGLSQKIKLLIQMIIPILL